MATKTWAWLTDSLHRLQAGTLPGRSAGNVGLDAARGERLSRQLGVRASGNAEPLAARLSCKCDNGLAVRIRRVGYVPVPHYNTPKIDGHHEGLLPGYVGDPLFEEDVALLWDGQTSAFWLTIDVAGDCRAGTRKVRLAAEIGGRVHRCELLVRVHDVTLQPRKDFPVTNWFYADALCDYYGMTPFSKAFWPMFRRYVSDIAGHGQDMLYVPVFTPPLDGVKRPTQLLKVRRRSQGRYDFDFADVRKWIRMAGRCGIRRFEFNHLFTQWGAANAIRIYHGQGADERLLWKPDTSATGRVYRTFLRRYLPALERFLRREGVIDRCAFHLSDEPHTPSDRKNYVAARNMLNDIAPWMKVMDALGDIDFAAQGRIDVPIVSIRTATELIGRKSAAGGSSPGHEAGLPCWVYYCCNPRGKYLNRLMDTPLAKIRMSGWLFYRTGAKGFLHWGYNYWYKRQTRRLIDPFTVSDALAGPEWPHGDAFMVYPGPEGPVDSVRWEVFAESLQDYALLQTLGVSRHDRLLAGIRDYNDFPFSRTWVARMRRRLFAAAATGTPRR